jgi:hypothetical protein
MTDFVISFYQVMDRVIAFKTNLFRFVFICGDINMINWFAVMVSKATIVEKTA